MALYGDNTTPFPPPAGNDPYFISREWCIGDSLTIINQNFTNFDTRLIALTGNFPVKAADLDDNAVINSKLRQSAGVSVIGRSVSTTGNPADIIANTDGYVLRRSGSTLGFGQIGSNGVANSSITTDKLVNGAITTSKILDSSVTSSKIGNSQVTTSNLADGAVTSAKIAGNTITGANILNGTITNAEVSNSAAIAGTKINPNFGSQNIITNTNISIGSTADYGGFYLYNRTTTFRGPGTTQPGPQITLDGYPGSGQPAKTIGAVIHTTGADSGGLLIIVGDNNGDESAIDVWNRGTGGSGATVSRGLKFRVESDGRCQAKTFESLSDRNKKTEIEDTCINGIEFINKFRIVDYLWKETAHIDKSKNTGLIAQEVQEIYPASVSNSSGDYCLDYNKFIGPIIKASQELSQLVKEQQNTIKNQQEVIEQLTEKVNAIEAKL